MCTHLWLSCHPQHMAHTTEYKYSTTQQHSRMINKNYDTSSQYKLCKWQSIASTCKNLNCKCTLIPAPNKRIKRNRFHLSLAALLKSISTNQTVPPNGQINQPCKKRGEKTQQFNKEKARSYVSLQLFNWPNKSKMQENQILKNLKSQLHFCPNEARRLSVVTFIPTITYRTSQYWPSTVLQQSYPVCVLTCNI